MGEFCRSCGARLDNPLQVYCTKCYLRLTAGREKPKRIRCPYCGSDLVAFGRCYDCGSRVDEMADENETRRKIDEHLRRVGKGGYVEINPRPLDWLKDTDRDMFGVPYSNMEKEVHARIRKVTGELDDRHLAPFLRVLDTVPIIGMAMGRLWELSNTSDPEMRRQANAVLKIAVRLFIEAVFEHLPPELRLKILEEIRGEEAEHHG